MTFLSKKIQVSVEILGQLNIDESIPEELYQAVSEVFAYIYQIDREHGLKGRKRIKNKILEKDDHIYDMNI